MKILPKTKLNCFLQTRAEIDGYTEMLLSNGLVSHGMICKNFDIAKIIPHIGDGNILDMGSAGSSMLDNVLAKGCVGLKYGIDLTYYEGYEYHLKELEFFKGDLMKTEFSDGLFNYLTCLSVIEHQVDYDLLAKECNRLLVKGGKLFITFDYWEPKVDTTDVGTALYGLEWNILDRMDTEQLIMTMRDNGLVMDTEMDWTTQDTVINNTFFAAYDKAYTFGIIEVTKQ